MTGYKTLIQHCRALLSLHHEFARKGFATGLAAIHDVPADKIIRNSSDGVQLDFAHPLVRTEDEILKDYFTEHKINDEVMVVFLTEVFNGCVRQRKALQVALKLFYKTTGERWLRNDHNLFAVLFYLILFRFNELTFPKLRNILNCYDATKMSRLVSFVFDQDYLLGPLREGWSHILDAEWVNEHMIDPIVDHAQDVVELSRELAEKAILGMVPKKSTKEPSVPEPFLLTRPRPRALPQPTEIVPNFIKARPVPKSVYQGTADRESLERIKAQNRARIMAENAKAATTQFKVVTRKSPCSTTQSTSQDSPLMTPPRPRFHKPVPSNLHDSIPVKLTTAAILREGALVQRNRKEEEARLLDAEMGLRDGAEFGEWLENARIKEEGERRLDLERRRLEIQLIHEDAYEAKQDLLKENRERAAEILAEREKLRVQAETTRKILDIANRKKVEEVQDIQEGIHKAKLKVANENSKKGANKLGIPLSGVSNRNFVTAIEVAREGQMLKEQAAKDAAEEQARKAEVIRQIRLLERSVPSVGTIVKDLDPTETSGLGLLGEMSLLELQERLVIAKLRFKDEEEERRKEILTQKQEHVLFINRKLEEIDNERRERRRRRREREAESVSRSVSALSDRSSVDGGEPSPRQLELQQDPKIRALQEKLASKRTARLSSSLASKAKLTPLSRAAAKTASMTALGKPHRVVNEWPELDEAEREYERKRKALHEQRARILRELEGDVDAAYEGDAGSEISGWRVAPVAVMV
ncbi:hypothetical protein DFS34DRAFT_300016 [Phlyctochytrium arcticum]|nr:hypothetical protein DFS34DRAFT_300016 [Phlyctochytrium arcticum]